MRPDRSRFIDIQQAAELIGKEMFSNDWTGSEFIQSKTDKDAKERLAAVSRLLRTLIHDCRVPTWTVNEHGKRYLLEKHIATDPGFGVWLEDGKVCGIWGPDSKSGCLFDRDKFLDEFGLSNSSKRGGRPPTYRWIEINDEIWRRFYHHKDTTNEKMANEISDWYAEKYNAFPDASDIKKQIRKIRTAMKDRT